MAMSKRETTSAFASWPKKDQEAWDQAIAPDDLAIGDDRELKEMRERTQGNVLQAVEGYFFFLLSYYPDLLQAGLALRFQRWAIEEYTLVLVARGLAPSTIVSYLERLLMAALRLNALSNWRWPTMSFSIRCVRYFLAPPAAIKS